MQLFIHAKIKVVPGWLKALMESTIIEFRPPESKYI